MAGDVLGAGQFGTLFEATGRHTEAIGLWGDAMLCFLVLSLAMRGPAAEAVNALLDAAA